MKTAVVLFVRKLEQECRVEVEIPNSWTEEDNDQEILERAMKENPDIDKLDWETVDDDYSAEEVEEVLE